MKKALRKRPVVSSREIGSTNILSYAGTGYLLEDELLASLSGSRGALTYRQMSEGSPVIGSILYTIRMFIDGIQWRFDKESVAAAGADEADEGDIEFLESVLFHDMKHSFSEFVVNSLTFLQYGFSISELVYKLRDETNSSYPDGRIGLAKIAHRPQETIYKWIYEDHGDLKAFQQYTNIGTGLVTIPIGKCVHFRTTTDRGTPEGRSVLRNAYRSWYFGRNIERIEAVGIERELAGLPIVTVPNKTLVDAAAGDPEAIRTRDSYLEISKNVRLNEQAGVILPSDTHPDLEGKPSNVPLVELKLLSSSGSRAIDTSSIVQRHETNIARSMMADFIMLGTSSGGAYSLGKDKSSVFEHCLRGWLTTITDTIQRQVVHPLCVMNGIETESIPHIGHSPLTRESLEEFSSSIERLARAGMRLFPSDEMEGYVRDRFEWPSEMAPEADLTENKGDPDEEDPDEDDE